MKKVLIAVAALAALPATTAQAQMPLQPGGFYIGCRKAARTGCSTRRPRRHSTCRAVGVRHLLRQLERDFNTGWVAGGALGYDFIGLRVEVEGVYRENTGTLAVGGLSAGFNFNEVAIMGNVFYDFLAGSAIVPYIGAGARCGVPQRGRSRPDAAEHAVRLSGHPRRGLEHRPRRSASTWKAVTSARRLPTSTTRAPWGARRTR